MQHFGGGQSLEKMLELSVPDLFGLNREDFTFGECNWQGGGM